MAAWRDGAPVSLRPPPGLLPDRLARAFRGTARCPPATLLPSASPRHEPRALQTCMTTSATLLASIDRPVAPLAPLIVLRHRVRACRTLKRRRGTRLTGRGGRGALGAGTRCRRTAGRSRGLTGSPGKPDMAMRAILGSRFQALPAQGAVDRWHSASVPKFHFTEYFVKAPPAWVSEFGPSAA